MPSLAAAEGLEAVSTLRALPVKGTVESIQIEITDDTSVDAVAAHVASTYGRVDVLVNNTGICSQNPVVRKATRETLAVNV